MERFHAFATWEGRDKPRAFPPESIGEERKKRLDRNVRERFK